MFGLFRGTFGNIRLVNRFIGKAAPKERELSTKHYKNFGINYLKGTLDVILSDPPCNSQRCPLKWKALI